MLTKKQIETRRQFITASDVAAIMGISPYKSANDVWHEKVYGTEGNKTTDTIDLGNRLEPVVLDWAENEYALGEISNRQKFISIEHLGATLDGTTNTSVVEAKTSGIMSEGTPTEWGEAGTDQIPESHLVQVQTQMLVAGMQLAHVAALIGRRGFVMYEVAASPEIQEAIWEHTAKFWNAVQNREPVLGDVDREVLKRLRREPNKTVLINGSILQELQHSKKMLKHWYEVVEKQKADLIASLGDAEAGTSEAGEITYLKQKRSAYTVQAGEHRVLRIKGEKCI
jgi:putative phage-type endonuclease